MSLRKSGRAGAAKKLSRIRSGEPPRVLDLFCGCGGFSLGFLAAGFDLVGGLDRDRDAAFTYAENFGKPADAVGVDLSAPELDPIAILENFGVTPEQIDVVVGGPPCQAFSRIGRAKLRDLSGGDENAWERDARVDLYRYFLDFVGSCTPLAVLVENVPDILHFGVNVPEKIAVDLEKLGYSVRYTLLNAAHYGVPQWRERFFLLAVHEETGATPIFPGPTRHAILPAGYEQIRASLFNGAIGDGRQLALFGSEQWVRFQPRVHALAPVSSEATLISPTACGEAISDLPRIKGHESGDLSPGMAAQNEPVDYLRSTTSGYSQLMREWAWPEMPERPASKVDAHAIRLLPRDYRIFRRMGAGDQYPEALKIARSLFEKELARRRDAGEDLEEGSRARTELQAEFVPPYPDDKFPAKWRKLDISTPAHTLTAHLGRDCYTHIHYDDEQARTISVREAARLQSFPDAFVFPRSMGSSFRMIGNAVPPLAGYYLAMCLRRLLRAEDAPEFVEDLVSSRYQCDDETGERPESMTAVTGVGGCQEPHKSGGGG